MNSRFTLFFILTRTLLLAIPVAFFLLPFIIYFNNDPKFKDEPKLLPAFIVGSITFPFAYLMARSYKVVQLKFDSTNIYITENFGIKQQQYRYTDVVEADFGVYKIEGVQKRRYWEQPDINYTSFTTICFADGNEIHLGNAVYSNCPEMLDYIESHKPIIQNL